MQAWLFCENFSRKSWCQEVGALSSRLSKVTYICDHNSKHGFSYTLLEFRSQLWLDRSGPCQMSSGALISTWIGRWPTFGFGDGTCKPEVIFRSGDVSSFFGTSDGVRPVHCRFTTSLKLVHMKESFSFASPISRLIRLSSAGTSRSRTSPALSLDSKQLLQRGLRLWTRLDF